MVKNSYEPHFSYLLNVTFHAGSNAAEDTDVALCHLVTTKPLSKHEVKTMFEEANAMLNADEENESILSISYEEGTNINTLIRGVDLHISGAIRILKDGCGALPEIADYYEIVQWQ